MTWKGAKEPVDRSKPICCHGRVKFVDYIGKSSTRMKRHMPRSRSLSRRHRFCGRQQLSLLGIDLVGKDEIEPFVRRDDERSRWIKFDLVRLCKRLFAQS